MAVFSTNQVRHLYVQNSLGTAGADGHMQDTTTGAAMFYVDPKKETFFLEYIGEGGRLRSDIIDVKSVRQIKYTAADRLKSNLYKTSVKLDSAVNGGEVIPGQDYILRIVFRQFAGMSDEDTYIKYGAVHGVASMTPSDFYKKLAISLAKNFSRELTQLLRFKVGDVEVTGTTKMTDLAAVTATEVTIEEVEQDWIRGTKAQVPVYFEVIPTTVTYDGEEVIWGVMDETTGSTAKEVYASIADGKKIADLEYFCHGERGDIYRGVGWPDVIPTKYMVDETKEYDVLDIAYYFEGAGENPQKSEKVLTVVGAGGVITKLLALLDGVDLSNKTIKVE
jgi:hypothetical protein